MRLCGDSAIGSARQRKCRNGNRHWGLGVSEAIESLDLRRLDDFVDNLTASTTSMETSQVILLLWSALVFWVLGQIWLVQVVVYPLFSKVGRDDYVDYHGFYSRHIPLPVIIPGFASFLLPLPLALYGPAFPVWISGANIAAGSVGLLVTVLLEIPRHARLQKNGKSDTTIGELIRYNWPRTLSITAQGMIALAMLMHEFGVAQQG